MSNSEDSKEQILDPNLVSELEDIPAEDPFVTEYGARGGGEDSKKIDFAQQWFPNEDEWQGKTNISPHQARDLALVRALPKAFPELEPSEKFLHTLVDNYEMYLTSIEGKSREDHVSILRALVGAGTPSDESAGWLASMFASRESDNED